MELKDLIGKNAIRTESVFFDDNDGEVTYYDIEDKSYTGTDYITVTGIDEYGIQYIQNIYLGKPSKKECEFRFGNELDEAFLDNCWVEYKV